MAVAALTRNWTKDRIRGSLSLYYIFIEGAAVIGYLNTGGFEREVAYFVLIGLLHDVYGFLIASLFAKTSPVHPHLNEP